MNDDKLPRPCEREVPGQWWVETWVFCEAYTRVTSLLLFLSHPSLHGDIAHARVGEREHIASASEIPHALEPNKQNQHAWRSVLNMVLLVRLKCRWNLRGWYQQSLASAQGFSRLLC